MFDWMTKKTTASFVVGDVLTHIADISKEVWDRTIEIKIQEIGENNYRYTNVIRGSIDLSSNRTMSFDLVHLNFVKLKKRNS